MYLNYYGLQEAPFSITPDPGFMYLSGRHRDALAHLLYGVGQSGSGGFVQLTGEVGTGKTTLCRALLEQVPAETQIALILNPLMNPIEMLEAICEELGISTVGVEGSSKGLVDRLNGYLLHTHAQGGRVVLLIDEAQNLSIESLEQVRLLTNLETSKEKLLQIILLGQPELRELLQRRSLRQLAQRITARYHLTPLGPEDTARYVGHRLAVAGASRNPFSRSGLKALYQRSQGVPRLVNIIADRSLAAGFAGEKERIDAALVNAAADEIQLGEPGVGALRWRRYAGLGIAAVLVLALGLAAGQWLTQGEQADGVADIQAGNEAKPFVRSTPETAPDQRDQPALAGDTSPVAPAVRTAAATRETEPDTLVQDPPSTPTDSAPGNGVVINVQEGSPAVDPAGMSYAAQTVALEAESEPELIPGQEWFEEQDLRAWQGLADLWGRSADAALLQATCQGRDGLGFACVEDQGNWLRIRQLGLPVILILQGAGSPLEKSHLLLTGMQAERLLVGVDTARSVVRRDDIEAHWYGDFLVAWPQAADWPREIGLGDSGEPVERVVQLATRTPEPFVGGTQFDEAFERWLVQFQGRNGLDADGIVGPKTLLYLMRYSIQEPRLLTDVEGEG